MAKSHAHVGAALHHTRTGARAATASATGRAPRHALTFAKGELVIDTQTGLEGVIVHGKKIHVRTQPA